MAEPQSHPDRSQGGLSSRHGVGETLSGAKTQAWLFQNSSQGQWSPLRTPAHHVSHSTLSETFPAQPPHPWCPWFSLVSHSAPESVSESNLSLTQHSHAQVHTLSAVCTVLHSVLTISLLKRALLLFLQTGLLCCSEEWSHPAQL